MILKTIGCVLILSLISNASKLNVPRILLPLFRDSQTNFTLEVTDAGCYNWTPLRPNIVRVYCDEPDPELGCCSRVVVAAASKDFRRDTETILAEDIHSGLVFRCEVILDVIYSLTIVTTTREMLLDESPEAFEVRAYDEQGNEFSTLEGVELDWEFRTVGVNNKSGESTVVRYMTFAESTYEAPKSIDAMERLGMKGHTILLEGTQTGGASVTVRLPQIEYAHVPAAGVQLLVRTNLLIFPQEATILKGDNIKYRLQQFQRGKVTEISFPSTQYHLASENSFVSVDAKSGIVTGLAIGKSLVVLIDRNGVDTDVKPPTAMLGVAVPHELSLAVLPARKWSVVVGQSYAIIAEVNNAERRSFHIGDNAVFGINLDESYFRVEFRPRNGSYVYGTPIKIGRVKVRGELLGVRDPLGDIDKIGPLTVAADLHIYDPIHLSPSSVVIPWDSHSKARYEIPFTATGGDGTYTWSSMRSAVAVVSQRGVAKTLEEGSTTIVASMTLNPTIRGISTLRVVPPVALEILDTALEAEIGHPIPVHILLYGEVEGKRVPFTVCDAMPFEITLLDNNFKQVIVDISSRPVPACATVFMTGITPGATQITVKYGTFSASAVIAAYRPLVPLNPASGTTLLAVGTSRLIVFTGGPRSWTLKPSENHHTLHNPGHEKEEIEVEEKRTALAAQKDTFPFLVTCRQLSETTLTLHVVNTVVGSSVNPSVASASLTVICGKPKFLQLKPVVKNSAKCPLQTEEIVALSFHNLELEVIVKDLQGRQFDNITSLELLWSLSKDTLAKPKKTIRAITLEEEGFLFPGSFIQEFTTAGQTGTLEIEGKINGYNGEVLFSQSINPPPFMEKTLTGSYRAPDMSYALSVKLVNATVVTPNKTEIVAGDGEVREMTVRQGSGYYEVLPSALGIVNVAKDGRKLRLRAIDVGTVGLHIQDLCLDTDPAYVTIQVYRLGGISLDVEEYVERGRSVQATVCLYDESGDALSTVPNPAVLKLTPLTGSDVLVVHGFESYSPMNKFIFTMQALALGDTTLVVSSGDIVSRAAPVHVFPPLRLNPRNVTLIVGSSVQVTTTDGPPGAHLEFTVDDGLTAKVSIDGIVEGIHIGDCSLTARAIVINRQTGQKIIASEDRVDVKVVPLKGVTIHTPIRTIVAGGKMPVWAVGPPGTAAVLRLGLSSSAMKFTWSVSQDSYAEIRTVFHDLGLVIPANERVVMRFFAIKPGRVVLTLKVRVPGTVAGTAQSVEYSDSVTVEIIPATSLQSPRPMNLEHLLISPQAVTQLRLTREVRRFQLAVLQGSADVVKVSQDGIVTSGKSHGAAVIAFGPPEKPWRHLIVYVKPVEYITVNVLPRWRLQIDESVAVIPNGMDLDLSVSFHDDEGNEFDAVRSNIVGSSDQKGVVNVVRGSDNGTLTLNVMESGATLIRVRDTHSANHPTNYIPVRSSEILYPPNIRVSVGDVICLRMPLKSADDASASWAVQETGKLRLWPELGVAVACGRPGFSTLLHLASPRLRSHIEIAPIQSIDLLPHEMILTTAPDAAADYPLVLSATGEKEKQMNRVAFNNTCGLTTPKDFNPLCYPFQCKLQFNNPITSGDIDSFFHVAPAFNIETGLYSCRVQSIAKASVATATLAEAIVLQAVTVDGAIMSRTSLIPFTPALFLHQSQITVTHSKPSDTFTVSGVADVLDQMKIATDKHLVSVSLGSQTETSRTYQVTVNAAWWSLEDPPTISVVIWSKLTSQKLHIAIRCGGLRIPPSQLSWLNIVQWIVILSIGVISATAVYLWTYRLNDSKANSLLTTESPYLRTPTLEDTLLSRARTSHHHSPESSPLIRPFDDYPVYGSPWRRDTGTRRRE